MGWRRKMRSAGLTPNSAGWYTYLFPPKWQIREGLPVRSYTRHQLKQDSFATSTADTISWAVDHRSKVTAAAIAVVVLLAILIGGWAYIGYRDTQAKSELSLALQKFNAPIRPAGTPPTGDVLSYASNQERSQAANAEFTHIASKYPFTQTSQVARYFAGISFRDLGNNAEAEKNLLEVSKSRYPEVASLAKMALAAVYHDTGRNPDAVDLYKQLIDHPTISVGKTAAQLALASLYEAMARPDDARHLYEQMMKESPASIVSQIATQKLQLLNKNQ
jgi:tetratricopeptide (TPR) repeat protein